MFDENMKWQSHINLISTKISRLIGIVVRMRSFLSSKELLLISNSLILPHISYCAVIWGSTYKSHLHKLILLQKRVARIIDKKTYMFPLILNDNLPESFAKLFKLNIPLNTRAAEHFVMPFTRYNFRMFSLSFIAPKTWNSIISPGFKKLEDVPRNKLALKKCIRNHLLNKYLGDSAPQLK